MTAHQETVSGPPHAHHMDAPTAYHAAKLGMWLFLATEILLFSVLFSAYAIFKWRYFPDFHAGSKHLDWRLGALNTAVLLISSYTAVLGLDAAQHGRNKKVVGYLSITVLCGLGFLVIKSIEYTSKYNHGFFPGGANYHEFQNFLGIYFCMTGLHALHVIIGMAILIWVIGKARKNRFSDDYYTPVELGTLYWHLVDLIWIYLFPLLYLVG